MWTSCLLLVDESFRGQRLARYHLQLLTSLAFHGNLWIAAQVLSHIENEDRILPKYFFDRIALHDLHAIGNLRTQLTLWSLLDDNGLPTVFAAVGVGGRNGFKSSLHTGIIVFTAIDAVEGDRTLLPLPLLVAQQTLAGVVVVGDIEHEQQGGGTKGYLQLDISATLFIIESVAQEHPELVVVLTENLGDIEDIEPQCLVVVAP